MISREARVPYLFLGDSPRTYPQFADSDSGCTLHAEPGQVYSMRPAAGIHTLAVPPGDGLWGPEIAAEAAPDPAAEQASTGQDPPPAKTTRSKAADAAEGE